MIIIQIAGHLGADPETRFTPSGQKVTTMRVATNVRKGGKDETVWWRVTIWGDRFDKMLTYLKKGSAVIVVGEMGKPEIYTDKEGRPQVSMDLTAEMIRFSPFGKTERTGTGQEQQAQGSQNQANPMGNDPFGSDQGFSTSSARGYGNQGGGYKSPMQSHSNMDEEPLPF